MRDHILQYLSTCCFKYFMSDDEYIKRTESWIKHFIIGLDICPFARAPFDHDLISYVVNLQDQLMSIANDVIDEGVRLSSQKEKMSTSFIICPKVDLTFAQWYEAICEIQELVDVKVPERMTLVAFHPLFVYEGEDPQMTTHSTNRSPHPMIHLLSSASMDEIKSYPFEAIVKQNQQKLSKMTWAEIRNLGIS